MGELKVKGDGYEVFFDGEGCGMVSLYDNPVHGQNCYVKLELTRWEGNLAPELFGQLAALAGKPLQATACSDDVQRVSFLTAGGFRRVRRCYEGEVSAEDCIGLSGGQKPLSAPADGEEAAHCRRILFNHYCETHRAVNPWTEDFDAFCRELPQEIFCQKTEAGITALAFVEGDEIAYIWAADENSLRTFAAGLLDVMFARYETICFESDDCDPPAMWLRGLFRNQDEDSFDTYVYP